MHGYLGHLQLHEVTRDLIDYIAIKRAKGGSQPATINRYLALIRAILRRSRDEWEWIEHIPKVSLKRERQRRVRCLTRDEFERLAQTLPDHLSDMARLAVSTGLRSANVMGLKWDCVDLTRRVTWVHAEDSKNGESIGVYLNSAAVSVIRSQLGKHETFVFTYRGHRVYQTSTKAWYAALKRVGIDDFRWHDLRHTWASWHVQNGTPLYALQEQGGGKALQWFDVMRI